MKKIQQTVLNVLFFLSITTFLTSCAGEEPLDSSDDTEQCEGGDSYMITGSVYSIVDNCTDVSTTFNGIANVSIIGGENNSVIATTQTNSSGAFEVTISGDVFEQYNLIDRPVLEAVVTYSITDCDGDPYTYEGSGDGELSTSCDWTIDGIVLE